MTCFKCSWNYSRSNALSSFVVAGCYLLFSQSSQLFVIPWTAAYHAFLSFTFSQSLFKLKSIGSVMPSNHFVLYHPLLLLQSFPASECFAMSWLFTSDSHNIGASASASAPPVNFQDWFPLGLTGLISLQPKGLTRVFSKIAVQKYQFLNVQPPLWYNLHWHMTTEKYKNIALTIWVLVGKGMLLLFNMQPRFVTASLLRNKCHLIS